MECATQQLRMVIKRRINLNNLTVNVFYVTEVRDGNCALKIARYNEYHTEYMSQKFWVDIKGRIVLVNLSAPELFF